MADILYEQDFVLWTERQAEELRRAAGQGSNLPLDWENLAEEIETLGRSQRSEAKSLVRNIIEHLIKLAYSPAQPNWIGWESEVGLFRDQLEGVIENSPSLRPNLPEFVERETPRALRRAVTELRKHGETSAALAVERTPHVFTVEQVLDRDWYLPGTHDRFLASRQPARG
jgi:hypothetical protein